MTRTIILFSCLWGVIFAFSLQLMYAKVHESITQEAAKRAGLKYSDDLQHGIRWNDMPCSSNKETTRAKVCSWELVADIEKPGTITYESHNGKYSFWHSMAVPGKYTNQDIVEMIIPQMKIWYQIAVQQKSDFSIGKCLHMIQDSYSRSHVARDSEYRIMFFQDYTKQNPDKHSNLEGGNICGRIPYTSLYGTRHAIEASTQMLIFYKSRAPWNVVERFLRNQVYKFAPRAANELAGGSIPEIASDGKGRTSYIAKLSMESGLTKQLKDLVQYRHELKRDLRHVKKIEKQVEKRANKVVAKPLPIAKHNHTPVYQNKHGHHHYKYSTHKHKHKNHYHIHHVHHHHHYHKHHHQRSKYHRNKNTLGFWSNVKKGINKVTNKAKSKFNDIKHDAKKTYSNTKNKVVNTANKVANKAKQVAKKTASSIVKTAEKLKSNVKDAIDISKRITHNAFATLGKLACRGKEATLEQVEKLAASLKKETKSLKQQTKKQVSKLASKFQKQTSKFVKQANKVLRKCTRVFGKKVCLK